MAPSEKAADPHHPTLFRPFRLGPRRMKNRLVALPVYTGYAGPQGGVSDPMVAHYARLSGTGAAMVVVANAAVSADGVVAEANLRIDRDDHIPGLCRLARAIRENGALSCIQLNHAGRFAKTDRPLLPAPLDTGKLSFNLASLRDFMNFFPLENRFGLTRDFLRMINGWNRAMTEAETEGVIEAFGKAAERAAAAGFEVVELHGAGGYLISQFLSAFTNSAPSAWGGDWEARTRFPMAVVRTVRNRLPPDIPLGFRLMLREWVPRGIDLPEALAFARLLQRASVAYLSPSAGSYNSMFAPDTARRMARPAYLRGDTADLRAVVRIPVILSGRVLTPAMAERLLQEGSGDLIGLGRPLRTDPDWIRKARTGAGRIVSCVNCNECLRRVVLDRGFGCARWPRWLQERADLDGALVRRNFDGLWVAVSPMNLDRFRAWLPRLAPEGRTAEVLVVEASDPAAGMVFAMRAFRAWAERRLPGATLIESVRAVPPAGGGLATDRLLHEDIRASGRGLVLICRNPEPELRWGERLLYRERGKVVGLLGTAGAAGRVLVPVDLSAGTLLTLAFLKMTRWLEDGTAVRFVHVTDRAVGPIRSRWKEIGVVMGIAPIPPLEIVSPVGTVAATLLGLAAAGAIDTVVMGKRGLSGIKRWLLGSVSAAVLKELGDRSLFLVD